MSITTSCREQETVASTNNVRPPAASNSHDDKEKSNTKEEKNWHHHEVEIWKEFIQEHQNIFSQFWKKSTKGGSSSDNGSLKKQLQKETTPIQGGKDDDNTIIHTSQETQLPSSSTVSIPTSNSNEISTPLDDDDNNNEKDDDDDDEFMAKARKVGIALAGTTLIAVGVPLIPLPGPGDFMVLGGFALLATEFPAAQRVLDSTRQGLVNILEKQQASTSSENKSEQDEAQDKPTSEEDKDDNNDPVDVKDDNDDPVDVKAEEDKSENLLIDREELQKHISQSKRFLSRQASNVGRNVILPLLDTVCSSNTTAAVTTANCNAVEDDSEGMCTANLDAAAVSQIQ